MEDRARKELFKSLQYTSVPANLNLPLRVAHQLTHAHDKTKLLLPALQIIYFLKGPKVRPNMV